MLWIQSDLAVTVPSLPVFLIVYYLEQRFMVEMYVLLNYSGTEELYMVCNNDVLFKFHMSSF